MELEDFQFDSNLISLPIGRVLYDAISDYDTKLPKQLEEQQILTKLKIDENIDELKITRG